MRRALWKQVKQTGYRHSWCNTDCGMNTSGVIQTRVSTCLMSQRLECGHSWVHMYQGRDLLQSHRLGCRHFGGHTDWTLDICGHADQVVETPRLTQSQVWIMGESVFQSVTPLESTFITVNSLVHIAISHPIISDCSLYFTSSDHFEVLISSVVFIPYI